MNGFRKKKNNIGIPTEYKGYRFRSRLEARWAAFFDLLNWKWEYEPRDFNGWIPDFALIGKQVTYVEIKPITQFDQAVADKIDASGCKDECLILGLCPSVGKYGNVLLGWLREIYYFNVDRKRASSVIDDDCNQIESSWAEAVFGQWEDSVNIGFCHSEGAFFDRMSGCYDGGSYGAVILEPNIIDTLWAKACNQTQWKGGITGQKKPEYREPLQGEIEEFERRRSRLLRQIDTLIELEDIEKRKQSNVKKSDTPKQRKVPIFTILLQRLALRSSSKRRQ